MCYGRGGNSYLLNSDMRAPRSQRIVLYRTQEQSRDGMTKTDGSEVDSPAKRLEHETEWIYCEVKDRRFVGHGGPFMLQKILETFLAWAREGSR